MNKQLSKIQFQDGATMDISTFQSTIIAKTMSGERFMFMSTKKLTNQDNDKISRLIQQLNNK